MDGEATNQSEDTQYQTPITGTPSTDTASVNQNIDDFKIEAFDILSNASDFNSGIKQLNDYYTKNKLDSEEARSVLAENGNNLRYKFEEKAPDPASLIQMLPIKPSDAKGADSVELINDWENKNIEALKTSKDPDQIAASHMLTQSVSNVASEMRRDALAGNAFSDKFYRFADSLVGPFAELAGYDSVDKYLRERTSRESDNTFASEFASVLGGAVPIVAGTLTGQPEIAVPAVIAAQAGGSARELYKKSIEETGNEAKARTGAALAFGAQTAVAEFAGKALAPIGDAITERLTGKTLSNTIKGANEIIESDATPQTGKTLLTSMINTLKNEKIPLTSVATSAIVTGTVGATGQIIGNIAKNIALNEDGDISQGIGNNFLAMAALAGVGHGAEALIKNASYDQSIQYLVKAREALNGKTPIEEPVTPKSTEAQSQFQLSPDGYVEDVPRIEPTVEDRHAAAKETTADATYYAEEIPKENPDVLSNETGDAVSIPVADDVEVTEAPPGTLIYHKGYEPQAVNRSLTGGIDLQNAAPSRFINWIAGKMGSTVKLARNVQNGATGSFDPNTGTIRLLRSLGANVPQLKSTLAHEFGHFIDKYLTDNYDPESPLGQMGLKFKGLADIIINSGKEASADVKRISMEWRGGWDGSPGDENSANSMERYNAYRNSPQEQYADFVSAIINSPDAVRQNYPKAYKAFEDQLSKDPVLNGFWNQLRDFEANPEKISQFNMLVANQGRRKQLTISAAAKAKDIQKNSFWERLKDTSKTSFEFLFQKLGSERAAVSKIEDPAKRNEAFQNLDMLQRYSYLGNYLRRTFALPMKSWIDKFQQTGLNAYEMAHYLWATRVTSETTKTINNIHESFDAYKQAAAHIKKFLSTQKGVKSGILDSIFNLDRIKTPDDLAHAFAQLGIVGDTSQVLNLNDFLVREDPTNPNAAKDALAKYNIAVAALNRKKESIPITALKKYAESLSGSRDRSGISAKVKEAIQDVTQDNAFAVRKYLVNAGGYDVYDAHSDINYLQQKLGPKDFQTMKAFSDSFHAIMNNGTEVIRSSGLFSPELLERMDLNRDNYVMSNVLRHFEGDESIDSTIRTAIGSLSETGNEIVSTYIKQNKIAARAYKQRSINAAIALADTNGHVVEKIPQEYNRSIFDLKNNLSAKDKENSYLIGYKEGVPTLYKISGGKTYENMFNNVVTSPALGPLLHVAKAIDDLLLTRTLKTALSPGFVLFNKFYDRRKEALLANSLEITLGLPTHSSPLLRNIDRASKESINHYLETRKETGVGELTGVLKDVVENDAALLQLHEVGELGLNSGTDISSALYEMFGEEAPDTRNKLQKIGQFTENALNKVGGDWLHSITDFDHLRTKLNGYQIGKRVFGMEDAEALTFSREKFGVPDTLGGGVGAPLINRMFLFGRAHLNELRTLGGFLKDNPKIAATQFAYRIVLPKALMIGAIGVPVMRAIFGNETSDVYDKFLQMVPEFEKISKNIIPLGFQDGQGNYHNFLDVKPAEMRPDWKAWYIRVPQAREITTLNKVFWPIIKYGIEGQVDKAINGSVGGALYDFASSVQPAIQYLTNLGQIVTGHNPTDFYRMKDIFSDDLQAGGTFSDKAVQYGKYFLAQQYPLAGTYRPFNPDAPKNIGEDIQATPFIGPLARTLTGVSNYGLYEKSKEGEALRIAEDAQIKRSTDEATQELFDVHKRSIGTIKAEGGKQKGNLEPSVRAISDKVNAWQARVWIPIREELRQAKDKGDTERYTYLLSQLKSLSQPTLQAIKKLSSAESKE